MLAVAELAGAIFIETAQSDQHGQPGLGEFGVSF